MKKHTGVITGRDGKPAIFGDIEITSVSREEWERMQREAKPLSELLKKQKV